MIGKLGWKKQKIDIRDWKFSVAVPAVLPVRSSLAGFVPPIKNQRNLGACTAFAYCTVIETMTKHHKVEITPYSPLFHYYITREYEGTVGEDSGCELRDTVKCGAKLGTCHEMEWPYKPGSFTRKPPAKAYLSAMDHQILTYEAITTLQEMKTCIAKARHPFLFGFYVYESFERMGSDWVLPMPKRGEQIYGGHAVVAIGYNDKKKLFTIQNSWGADWGDAGKFYMPYDFITNQSYAMDFWRINRGELM